MRPLCDEGWYRCGILAAGLFDIATVSLALGLLLARFLHHPRIFLRV